MLEVDNLTAGYGAVTVVRGAGLRVETGELVTLVGGNGAGKTTLIKTVTGLVPAQSGSVRFAGVDLTGADSRTVVEAGIVLIPEGRLLFPAMTVRENLLLGGINRRARPERRATMGRVYELFPRLRERESQLAGTLSGGEQQMVAIGRGLMALPKLLILDEPSLGLSPLLVQETFMALRRLSTQGMTILLVEQNVQLSLALCSRGYVMENGRMVLEGTSAELLADPMTKKAYLGL